MGGTEQSLQLHLQKVLDARQGVPGATMPAPQIRLKGKDTGTTGTTGAEGFGPGTPNHKGLRVVADLVDQAPGSIQRLLAFLTMQEERGHCCAAQAIETMTASHGQLHVAWAGVAYYLLTTHTTQQAKGQATKKQTTRRAKKQIQQGDSQGDPASQAVQAGPVSQTLQALRRWWWSLFALCAACEIPGAKDSPYPEPLIWSPGWRAKIDDQWVAANPARDLCYSLIMGTHMGEEGDPYRRRLPPLNRKLWRDKYNNGPRALSLLSAEDLTALLPPPGWVPPVPYAFHSRRNDRSFVSWFDIEPKDTGTAPMVEVKPDGTRLIHERADLTKAGSTVDWIESIDYPAVSFER